MKLLLTSAGIKNPSIEDALVDLLGKPIAESSALAVPTALHAQPGGQFNSWRMVAGKEPECPFVELGWKSMGLLELTALPSVDREVWVPLVEETDALLVGGGDPMYLAHWMQQSGLAELLPSLAGLVYVGLSAGSMIMAPDIGEDFVRWSPPEGGSKALGLVDFAMFPHLDNPSLPTNTMPAAEQWAAGLDGPAYAMDDETAIKVSDGAVEVISEGNWKALNPSRDEAETPVG